MEKFYEIGIEEAYEYIMDRTMNELNYKNMDPGNILPDDISTIFKGDIC